MPDEIKPVLLCGHELRVGDVIDVWWEPNRDTITKLVPYEGPLKTTVLPGARLADFALNKTGMTIPHGTIYKVFNRG